jgi:hemin uptake protein HemP
MSEVENRRQKEANQQETTSSPVVLDAQELFQGRREVCIEHAGKRYRLRITRRNKLILQK